MDKLLSKYGDIFTEKEISEILPFFEEKEFKKNQFLLETGNYSHYEYYIIKGSVRCYVIDYNGKEHNILLGTEDFWIGDLHSFLNKTQASYTIQALEYTKVLSINRENWNIANSTQKAFFKYTRTLFKNATIAQQERIVDMLSLTAKQRYQKLINKQPQILKRFSQKHIASFLGITPEFLSFIRKQHQ